MKPIPGFEAYSVSEDGHIIRNTKSRTTRAGLIMKARLMPHGYFYVTLSRNNKSYCRAIHHLVAITYLGKRPSPKHEVAHNDGVRTHNHYTNLRWATRAENASDMARHGTLLRGIRQWQAKVKEEDVVAIRALAEAGLGGRRIGKVYGINQGTVHDIVHRRTWKHVA